MIYIDTNVFIYAIENHPKYGSRCKKVLKDMENGRIKAAGSILVLVEIINVLNKLNKELRHSARQLDVSLNIAAIESLPITWLDLNLPIIERAAQYNYAINAIDYIHLATMELNQVNEIISADGDLDKAKWITRTDPLDYK
jgi:predicted nucleic acid-binding protein